MNDINKIRIYSITGLDASTKTYLVLEESDTISLSVPSPLESVGYPVIALSYNLKYAGNTLFLQNSEFYIEINGVENEIELLESAVNEDSVQVSFKFAQISRIDSLRGGIYSNFFDSSGSLILNSVNGDDDFWSMCPTIQDKAELSLLKRSYTQYNVIDSTSAIDIQSTDMIKADADAIWTDPNILVYNSTTGTWSSSSSTLPSIGDTIRVYEYVLNNINNQPPETVGVYVQYFNASQFTFNEENSAILDNIPDTFVIVANTVKNEITVAGHTVLVPCLMVPKTYSYYKPSSLPPMVYAINWFLMPLFKELHLYVKKVWVSDLPYISGMPQSGLQTLLEPEYRVTTETLPYYTPGADVNETMYNPAYTTPNGKWTPVSYENAALSVYDIISDICYRDVKVLLSNSGSADIPSVLPTLVKQTTKSDDGYEYKASDIEKKYDRYIGAEGFNLSSTPVSNTLTVCKVWNDCVPPLQGNIGTIMRGGAASAVECFPASRYSDAKYDADGNEIRSGAGITQYRFEGYMNTVSALPSGTLLQNVIPESFMHNGGQYTILGIDNFNLRTGYISGICYV